MEEKGSKSRESVRTDILSREDGFNTRVNLFIIRYLYYHMKKASSFMKAGKGKRQMSVDIKEYVGIPRQRFDRIFKGDNFQITEENAKDISGLFNISADYFKKSGLLIEIYGIDRNDWKCYFSQQYKGSVESAPYTPKVRTDRAVEVDKKLCELIKGNYIAKHYDTKTTLYRIHYYFENGVAFKEVSPFNKFLENLQLIKISDWKELEYNPAEMAKYLPLLKKHYEYINAYLKCKELEQLN